MDPLTRPVLEYPTNRLVITDDNTPTLDWQPVVNGVTYLVQISKVSDFSTLYLNAKVSETEYETPELANRKYYWRVRAIDASGGKGPWSEIRTFKDRHPITIYASIPPTSRLGGFFLHESLILHCNKSHRPN